MAALTTMEAKLLAGDVSKQTHDSIIEQLLPSKAEDQFAKPADKRESEQPKPPDASTMAGLLLGSPEFQRR
jgi:hypothetical protein